MGEIQKKDKQEENKYEKRGFTKFISIQNYFFYQFLFSKRTKQITCFFLLNTHRDKTKHAKKTKLFQECKQFSYYKIAQTWLETIK